jgi:hypothetical protein
MGQRRSRHDAHQRQRLPCLGRWSVGQKCLAHQQHAAGDIDEGGGVQPGYRRMQPCKTQATQSDHTDDGHQQRMSACIHTHRSRNNADGSVPGGLSSGLVSAKLMNELR